MTGSETDDRAKQIAFKTANLVPGLMAYWDRNQRCLYSNDAYVDWFGIRSKDMAGIGMKDLLGPLYEKNLPYIEKALVGKKQVFERKICVPSGEVRNSLAIYTPDLVDGTVLGFTAHVVDVTALRQREAAWENLARERAGLSQMAENHPDIISRFDRNLRHLYVSREVERVTGISPAFFIGKTNEQLGMAPELCERWNKLLRGVFARGERQTIDFTFVRGEIQEYYSAVCVPEFSLSGEIQTVLCVARNVTDLSRAAASANRREARLNLITEAANFGVFEWDFPDGAFQCNNNIAAEVLELAPGAVTLSAVDFLQRLLITGTSISLQQAISKAIASGDSFRQVCGLRSPKGNTKWVEFFGRIERNDDGKSPKCVGFLKDVTDEVLTNHKLADARDAAENANAAKDRFLATLSHELRTPLTPALMLLQTLKDSEEISSSVRRDLEVIRENVEVEVRLVDDLLDLARVANGKLRIALERCNPDVILERALRTVAEDFSAKRITINTAFAANPGLVLADPTRLQQICWNLLRNAAKFSPVGGRVDVRTISTGYAWKLSITDFGIGLAKGDLTRIFEPLVQILPERGTNIAGLGLGLSISAHLVREHKGRIWAESEGLGKGATLRVEIPAASPASLEPHAAIPAAASFAQMKILVVEDDRHTRNALVRILTLHGHDVRGAHSIAEAKAVAANSQLDLLICDLGLPDGHGAELLRYIKERQPIRSVALSGNGMEAQMIESGKAGFDLHLVKPISIAVLEQAISRLARPGMPDLEKKPIQTSLQKEG